MEEILLITLLTIVASGIGTLSGFGSSTVMVPVLLLYFGFQETLLLAGALHMFNDIWKLSLFKGGIKLKFILLFGIPGVIFSYLGASLIFNVPEMLMSRLVGGFLIIYVVYLFAHRQFKIKDHPFAAVVGGTLSGFSAGVFGLGGAIRSAFLSAYNLPKSVYLATAGAIALMVDSVRVTTYIFEGAELSRLLVIGLIIFIPASFYGAMIAKLIVDKIPQKQFRLVLAVFLLLAATKLVFFP